MIRFNLDSMPPDLAVAALRNQKSANKAVQMPDSGVLWLYPGYANVRSEKGHGSYVVMNSSPDLTGKWSCSCPHYQYRMAAIDGQCKHIIKARMNIDDWEEPQSQHLIHRVDDLIEQGKTATREDCTFNAETCQGCMLFQNCKGHAERVEAT
jgi:hypothetical protein